MEQINTPRLKIPFEILEDHIQCSICLSALRGSVLTPCGHRYCYKCISEWIGREHSCPCCKKQLDVNSFYHDVQFDHMVEQMLLHRDQAEQEHFDKLFNTVTAGSDGNDNNNAVSPFQEILRKHLKKSMISVEQYFLKLQQDFKQKTHKLECGMIPDSFKNTGKGPEEVRIQIEGHLKDSEKLAADALDRYLTNNIPSLDFLPVTVSVYCNDKRIRLQNIEFKPTDKMTDIRIKIEEGINKHNDEITAWIEEGGTILLINPLSKMDHYNVDDIMMTIANRDDISLLSWNSQPVLQNFMRPGSEIVLHKTFQLQADAPLRCYAKIFKEKGAQPVDYFSCEDCNSKWICKSCAQGCHSGHKMTTFVLKHTPSWGCCYCPKKKLCQIQNNV